MTPNLFEQLRSYGLPNEKFVIGLSGNMASSQQMRYGDLVRRKSQPETKLSVDCVVENETKMPLLYVVDDSRINDDREDSDISILQLRRSLAMRGDNGAWVGLLNRKQLNIYTIDAEPGNNTRPQKFEINSPRSASVIPRLALGELSKTDSAAQKHVRDSLFELMNKAAIDLIRSGLDDIEAIALTGRALFLRYLIGRKIVHNFNQVSSVAKGWRDCMTKQQALVQTNQWLDDKFNGDLLKPCDEKQYENFFSSLVKKNGCTRTLGGIMTLASRSGINTYQEQLNWGHLEFEHVPIGLLSEAYENLIHEINKKGKRSTSVYYTPQSVVEYMVDDVFHQLPDASNAKVLDPACGAGIFLVCCFRKLVEANWDKTGKRPETKEIRDILNNQLVGMDTNPHARSLATLSLYLTALDLDPNPSPVEKLKFEPLKNKVIVDVGYDQQATRALTFQRGSLSKKIYNEIKYRQAFDIVIGNPPWTPFKDNKVAEMLNERCRSIAKYRCLDDIAKNYKNPGKVPDLPFVWMAMNWAKKDGRIAFALHARLLFKQSTVGFHARRDLFRALKVTGVLNMASLRETKVWPATRQPFCLLFADNKVPEPDYDFLFLSPRIDEDLNKKGLMRIDNCEVMPVTFDTVHKNKNAFNVLSRGSTPDVSILDKLIQSAKGCTVEDYWRMNRLYASTGFKGDKRSKTKKKMGSEIGFMKGLPYIPNNYEAPPYYVDAKCLTPYSPPDTGIASPRSIGAYRGPLLVFKKGMRRERESGRAFISESSLVYSDSYYGYSAFGHEKCDLLLNYMQMLLHSSIFEYYALMTSGTFGVERDIVQKQDIDEFPFVDPEDIDPDLINNIANDFKRGALDGDKLDTTVKSIYGLSDSDLNRINDALQTAAQYATSQETATQKTTKEQRTAFISELIENLQSLYRAENGWNVCVESLPFDEQSESPWHFFSISLKGGVDSHHENQFENPMSEIKQFGASQIYIPSKHGSPILTVGLMDQYRYWIPSQAQFLAHRIIWTHGAKLESKVHDA